MRASDQLPLHHNAAEWFVGRHLREGRGQSPALLGDGFQLSYAQLDEEVRRFAAALRDARTHRDAFCFMLYSSGTTGEPKGVMHLQHDMWVCCETYGKSVLQTKPGDRAFSIAKLFFAYGLGNAQYFPMHVGASAVLFAGR